MLGASQCFSAQLATFAVLLVPFGLLLGSLPQDRPIAAGVIGSTFGGFLGILAFAAACGLCIRRLAPFGVRPVARRWFGIAAAVGLGGYGLNLVIQTIYVAAFGNDDPQGVLHAAARGGVVPFVASLLGGAIFTPFGEEMLFRGVVVNALNRHGAWAGIGLSSAIFELAHGVSIILPVAIMVGLLCAILFRQTGSVWPSVVLHAVYNGANSVVSAMGF